MGIVKTMRELLNILRPSSEPALLRDETGQAATEYALIASMTVLLVIASLEAMEQALWIFYQDVASLICLPIP